MESPDVIPIIVLRVENLAHCEDCPRDLREALQKMDGTHEVHFDTEYKKVFIRSSLDPLMIIKKIAKMNKSAELIFYDKEPILEGHNHKTPSSREKHPRRDEDKQNATHNGKGKHGYFSEKDHGRDAEQQRKKNARENSAEKYHCCRDYHDAREKEDGHKSDEHYKHNFSKKNSCYRDYHDVHKDEENEYCTKNIGDDGREKTYRCPNYDRPDTKDSGHGTSSDKKKPNMFFDDDIFKTFSKGSSAFWSRDMPSGDNGTMFENYNDPDHFCSKSCWYDARNSQHWYNTPCPTLYEHCNSTMPPSYEHHHSTISIPLPREQHGSSMPPPPPPPPPPTYSYYSHFSDENPNGCIIN